MNGKYMTVMNCRWIVEWWCWIERRTASNFKIFFRTSNEDFENLICLVDPAVNKRNTDAISVMEHLAMTPRFSATGDSYHSMMYLLKVSTQSVSLIIPLVCEALINALDPYVNIYIIDLKMEYFSIIRCKWKCYIYNFLYFNMHISLRKITKQFMKKSNPRWIFQQERFMLCFCAVPTALRSVCR
jgi:hypothetical protein